MASTFGSLEIAKSGMLTYNAALQTTAHNIANIETEGYSKQTVNVESMVANKTSVTVQGFGVNVKNITRQRNEYYDTKYQSTKSILSKYETESYYLNRLQDYICAKVTSDGSLANSDKALMSDAFDEFFSVLSNLVGNPNNSTIRTQAVTTAQTMTGMINNVATNLQALQEEANTEIKSSVDEINAYADKIVSLTKQINTVEAYGSIANDLRDQRSLLIDELSEFCNVSIKEQAPADGVGTPQYYVYINGGILVDTYNINKLVLEQKDTYSNIGDVTGCYDIKWADGTDFVENNNQLGGKLQSLFETRDGNNSAIVKGTATSLVNNTNGNLVLTIADTNCNDVTKLNIPSHDGEITVNQVTYAYESFEVIVDEAGEFTYQFTLQDTTEAAESKVLQNAILKKSTVNVGTAVSAKGIPYYMAQLNEFVRTFAQEFNTIQNKGLDLYGEMGMDFFNGTVPANGENYVFTERTDGKDASFGSLAEKNEDGTYTGSYYYMTALNFCVTEEVLNDGNKIACKGVPTDGSDVGNDNGDNVQLMTELKDNSSMFVHGAPDSFLQSLTSILAVNAQKAETLTESQTNILYAIDSNRTSISGVDEDEEGADMIVFQNMLMNQYKVLSVMNEVLDKLINGTV